MAYTRLPGMFLFFAFFFYYFVSFLVNRYDQRFRFQVKHTGATKASSCHSVRSFLMHFKLLLQLLVALSLGKHLERVYIQMYEKSTF